MIAILVWIALSIVVGWAGSQKGRSGGGFFLLSLLLSPLIGILVVIAVPRVEPPKVAPRPAHVGQKRCVACAEWILPEAKKCKHCGEMQPEPLTAAPQPASGPPRWDKVNAIERELDQHTEPPLPKSGGAFPWVILVLMAAVAIWALSSDRAKAETSITDGDTLRLNGTTYRLHGIDAAEARQWCGDYPAGAIAARTLEGLVRGGDVTCEPKTTDRYGRVVAVCLVDGRDLGKAMVRLGAALAFTRYASDYVADEEAARADGLGVHARACVAPWVWRAEQRR